MKHTAQVWRLWHYRGSVRRKRAYRWRHSRRHILYQKQGVCGQYAYRGNYFPI